jgi:hypothetical protein
MSADAYLKMAEEAMGETGEQQTKIDARMLELESQMLTLSQLRDLPPPVPLVEGYLFKEYITWLSGKPGHYKSFVAGEIACCVATGTPWHGHKVAQGKVLYLIAEGARGFPIRVDAWIIEHKTEPAESDIRFLPVPVQVMQDIDEAALTALLVMFKPVLLVIDTQARVTVGFDENSGKDMGEFVAVLGRIRDAVGCAILVVHHEPRNGTNLRGHTSLEGGADTILRCEREGQLLTVMCMKQKDAEEPLDMELALEPRGLSAVLVRRASHHKGFSDNERKLLDVVASFVRPTAKTTLKEAADMKPATFYRTWNKLESNDFILSTPGRGGALLYYAYDADAVEEDS